jgi:hypothetical protein
MSPIGPFRHRPRCSDTSAVGIQAADQKDVTDDERFREQCSRKGHCSDLTARGCSARTTLNNELWTRAMDFEMTVVVNEPCLAKLVHEMTYQFSGGRAGRGDCQCEISRAWQFSNKTSHARPFLQQAFPCMVLENLCVPNVTPQCIHALVPRLIGHLEDRGSSRRSAGQEA